MEYLEFQIYHDIAKGRGKSEIQRILRSSDDGVPYKILNFQRETKLIFAHDISFYAQFWSGSYAMNKEHHQILVVNLFAFFLEVRANWMLTNPIDTVEYLFLQVEHIETHHPDKFHHKLVVVHGISPTPYQVQIFEMVKCHEHDQIEVIFLYFALKLCANRTVKNPIDMVEFPYLPVKFPSIWLLFMAYHQPCTLEIGEMPWTHPDWSNLLYIGL